MFNYNEYIIFENKSEVNVKYIIEVNKVFGL